MIFKKILMAIGLTFMLTSPSHSAMFSTYGDSIITLTGEIVEGDFETFDNILKENPNLRVLNLNSPGGIVNEAFDIAALVFNNGMITSIEVGGECNSMCPIIFLSGREKFMAEDQILAFHPAFVEDIDGNKVPILEANLAISWWLGTVGVPYEVVQIINSVEPDKLSLVGADTAEKLNLGIRVIKLKNK